MNLQNKVAWISGGARMGTTVARALSQEGCRIVFSYLKSKEAAEDSVKQVAAQGGQAMALQCDVSKRADLENAVQEITKRFQSLDIVVNLSSIYKTTSLSDGQQAEDSWDAHLKANAESAYLLSLSVAPWMTKQADGGRIIHISDWTSVSGRPRYKDYVPYYVSKAAVKSVVEGLALALAPKILINAIAPGPILPPPGMEDKEVQAVMQATPLGRWGGPEEIAKTVLFLAKTDFVTGETIRVDGGRHLY